MVKRILLSSLAGVFLTTLVMAAPVADAACQGYCADRKLQNGCELGYAGCTIYYNGNDQPVDVDCFYTGACENLLD
jgi:hypothetical protein